MADLARVFDEAELSRIPGGHASLEITVPEAWAGRVCAVDVPARLACAACDGGGCDACERRGAFRLELEAEARRVEVTLPPTLGARTRIRIGRPFGDDATVGMLLLDVVVGEPTSRSCSVLEEVARPLAVPDGDQAPRRDPARWVLAALLLVLVGVIIARVIG